MSYIVRVERSHTSFTRRVWIARTDEDGQRVRLFTKGSARLGDQLEVPAGSAPPEDAWFCEIPDGAEHQLLVELAQHLGSVDHPLQLRKDFEHERGRVDALIGSVTDLAARLAGR